LREELAAGERVKRRDDLEAELARNNETQAHLRREIDELQQQLKALQGPRRAHYCLSKPVDVRELRRTVEVALKECGHAETVRQFEALERSRRVDALELFSRSTDRLSRQNHILELVGKSHERPNISALARQFNVARRTIIRDLQELIRRGQLKPEVYPEWEDDEPRE